MKLGTLIAIPTIYYNESITGKVYCSAPYEEMEWKYYGGIAIGGIASGGATYKIRKWIEVFAELKMISLSYAPTKGKITKNIINGIDIANSMPPNDGQIVFLNNLTIGNNITTPSSEPYQQLKYHFPFSSWGINLGVKFNINKTYYRKRKPADKGLKE
jgi:hypothetical protein